MEKNYLTKALNIYCLDPGLALHRAVEAKMFSQIPLVSKSLDLGCGDGSFVSLSYGALNNRILSPSLIGQLSKNAKQIDVGLDRVFISTKKAKDKKIYKFVVVGDINKLPFKNHMFNTIISNSVMTHIIHLENGLTEINRILFKKGKFVFTVPSQYFEDYLFYAQILTILRFKKLSYFFSRKYSRKYKQYHLLEAPEWAFRLGGAGMILEDSKYYLSRKGSFIWSLLFVLGRVGYKRFTLGGLFRKMSILFTHLHIYFLKRIFSKYIQNILRKSYLEEPQIGGSLFIVARKIN